MKLLWQDAWQLRRWGQHRPEERGYGLRRRLTWRSSSDRKTMLDRSAFSCLATFFHFNPAPLSVSSPSKDSWVIQAVPPSDTWEKMPVRVRLTGSAVFTSSSNSDLEDVGTSFRQITYNNFDGEGSTFSQGFMGKPIPI